MKITYPPKFQVFALGFKLYLREAHQDFELWKIALVVTHIRSTRISSDHTDGNRVDSYVKAGRGFQAIKVYCARNALGPNKSRHTRR